MSVEVEYDAQLERRAGKSVMVVRRTVTSVPESKRGREFSKQSREHSVQVIPLAEVSQLMDALVKGLTYPVEDELGGHDSVLQSADLGDEPQFLLIDTAGSEPMKFWSFYEADAHVCEMRAQGRIVKGWSVWRASEWIQNNEDAPRGFPLEAYGA